MEDIFIKGITSMTFYFDNESVDPVNIKRISSYDLDSRVSPISRFEIKCYDGLDLHDRLLNKDKISKVQICFNACSMYTTEWIDNQIKIFDVDMLITQFRNIGDENRASLFYIVAEGSIGNE